MSLWTSKSISENFLLIKAKHKTYIRHAFVEDRNHILVSYRNHILVNYSIIVIKTRTRSLSLQLNSNAYQCVRMKVDN